MAAVANVAVAYQPAGAATPIAGTYRTVTATRVLDTGHGVGVPAKAVPAHGSVNVTLTGRGGVPSAGAGVVALNVIAGSGTSNGAVTVYAVGASRPSVPNFSYVAKQSTANLVLVAPGSGGQVTLYNNSAGTVQLLADTQGYYVSGTGTAPGTHNALTPARVLDTSTGVGTTKKPVPANSAITFQVGGRGGVPSTAATAWLSLTASSGTAKGYVNSYPSGQTRPGSSNLAYVAGQANSALIAVPLGSNGKVTVYNQSSGTVQLAADAVGWDVSGASSAQGTYHSVTARRILDTGSGVGAPKAPVGSTRSIQVQVAGVGGVPSAGADTVLLSVSAGSASANGFVTAYSAGGPVRQGADIDFQTSRTTVNTMIVPVGRNGMISLYNGSGGTVNLIADVLGYFSGPVWQSQTLPISTPGPADLSATSIADVSCPSTTSCVAVGNFSSGTLSHPFAATLAGGSWTISRLPQPDPVTRINAVRCFSATSCIAVGTSGGDYFSHPLVETLTSAGWTARQLDTGGALFEGLNDVSCIDITHCTAVGSWIGNYFDFVRAGLAATLDGSTWTVGIVTPNNGSYDSDHALTSVSCSSAAHCVALGGIEIDTDNTTKQQIVRQTADATWTTSYLTAGTEQSGPLRSVSCLSDGSCRAVGTDAGGWVAATITATTIQAAHPLPAGPSADLTCRSATDCTAVGDNKSARLSGSTWSTATLAPPSGGSNVVIKAVSCPSSTVCVAAGTDVTSAGKFQLLATTRSSSAWTPRALPAPVGPVLASLRGVSCPTATACLAVGSIVDAGNTTHPLVASLASGSWTTTVLPTDSANAVQSLTAVSCTSATNCVAVGYYRSASSGVDQPLIETLSGSNWTPSVPDSPDPSSDHQLNAVSCPATGQCVAVGNGFAERLSSGSWDETTLAGTPDMTGVSCTSVSACVAVAGSNTETLQGITWTDTVIDGAHTGSADYVAAAVSCAPTTEACTAVGVAEVEVDTEAPPPIDPLVTTLSSGTWSEVSSDAYYESTVCAAPASCVVAGNATYRFDFVHAGSSPLLERLDGTVLVGMPTAAASQPPAGALHGVSCAGASPCAAAGTITLANDDQLPFVEVFS